MATPNVREKLITKLDTMTDEQVTALLSYAEAMLSTTLPDDYDEEHDPSVGFFSGPSDLGSRTREILRAEFGLRKSSEKKADP